MSKFNLSSSELKKIQALCNVLHHLDITTFFQLRITSTGKVLLLSNSRHIYTVFESEDNAENYFFELIKNSFHGAIKVDLWPSSHSDKILARLKEMNICHGLSISYALEDYIDIFSFATNQYNVDIINIYLNHLPLLKRFIVYFRFKSKGVLSRKVEQGIFTNNKVKFSKNLSGVNLTNLGRFKHKILTDYIKTILLKKTNNKMTLTKKEMDYLIHLLEGKNIKFIADELSVSRGTVKDCLNKIKCKIGFYTRDQLISFFDQELLLMEVPNQNKLNVSS